MESGFLHKIEKLEKELTQIGFYPCFNGIRVLTAIIDALLNFDLTIEIIGTWIWVSGDTFAVKAQLKELGFKWASKKKAWYWHPEGYVRMHKKNFTLDEIKNMHGSQTLKTSSKKLLLV